MNIFKKEKPQADAPASTWEENKYLYYAVMKPDRLAAEMERKRISWEKLRDKAWLFPDDRTYINTYLPVSIETARRIAKALYVPLEEIAFVAQQGDAKDQPGGEEMRLNTLELYPGGPVILNGRPLEWVISVDVRNIGTLDTMEATLRIAVNRVDIHHSAYPVPMKAAQPEQEPENKED